MLYKNITSLPRNIKRAILLASDTVILVSAILTSFSLRLGEPYLPPGLFENNITWLILLSPVIAIPVFIYFGLYRAVIRYIGPKIYWSLGSAVCIYSVVWGLVVMMSEVPGIPRSVIIINCMVALFGIGGSRALARYILRQVEDGKTKNQKGIDSLTKVLIYGAGAAGRQLAVGLNYSLEYEVCGFVDDDELMYGRDLVGYPVVSFEESETLINAKDVTEVLLAIPSISRKRRNNILKKLQPLKVRIRTLPGLSRLSTGPSVIDEIRDLDIDDLLMREPVVSDDKPLLSITKGKVVMVTGAGGSIGSEICRQLIKRSPKIVLLLEISEYALYEIHQQLESICATLVSNEKLMVLPRVIPFLGSVQDEARMTELIQTWGPDIIYHAAAYKHVPMVEGNLSEGIKNNVFGTMTLAKVAVEQGTERFVLISTDKAVNPTNGMGASKRVAELILQAISAEKSISFESFDGTTVSAKNNTQLSMVRFGNVLGSSGSVVPLFRRQIRVGGPVTLTHKSITRYFMTISEASQLVMHSAAMKSNKKDSSKVYVLDMGEPVRIIDLARRMIELSGLRVKDEDFPEGDIDINITGLRPGEKLYEELLIGNNPEKTINPKILMAHEDFIAWHSLQEKLQTLRLAADNNDPKLIVHILKELVTGYEPESNIADYVYKEQKK